MTAEERRARAVEAVCNAVVLEGWDAAAAGEYIVQIALVVEAYIEHGAEFVEEAPAPPANDSKVTPLPRKR